MSGIYIHIPFCKQACTYCDFHFSTALKNKSDLVKALAREIDLRHAYLSSFDLSSIYFGGGTPSLLTANELSEILGKLSNYYSWDKSIEITLEANPDDIDKTSLEQSMWAAIILKVMHTILHTDKHLRLGDFIVVKIVSATEFDLEGELI